ncbi:MAG TPA: hypothetical protein VGS07_16155 [Thermoanaerobaculia bacterium]|jgi:hypothetical protein|nr:hypothetical protein [Thermoanaerobaculia bacterium]
MKMTRFHAGIVVLMLTLGLNAAPGRATQYDAPLNIATVACGAGSTGYDNARFLVFPFFGATPPNWRLTIWCNAGGSGFRSHFEPGVGGVFTTWPGAGSAFGIGWPPSANYGNQYQLLDIDIDGDLDVFELRETATNTWSVFLSKAR